MITQIRTIERHDIDGVPPNDLPITRAAPRDRESGRAEIDFQNVDDFGPHSGVDCMGLLVGTQDV